MVFRNIACTHACRNVSSVHEGEAMTPREVPPFETSIRPELIDALCQITGSALPVPGMGGRRMMSLTLDTNLAHYFHQEAKRRMGLVRSHQRFGGRVTASSLLCEAMSARLPSPDDYVRLSEATVRRREIYGDCDISVRVPATIRERLEMLAETLPARKGIGFMSPKALAEVLALAWAGGNPENPFDPRQGITRNEPHANSTTQGPTLDREHAGKRPRTDGEKPTAKRPANGKVKKK